MHSRRPGRSRKEEVSARAGRLHCRPCHRTSSVVVARRRLRRQRARPSSQSVRGSGPMQLGRGRARSRNGAVDRLSARASVRARSRRRCGAERGSRPLRRAWNTHRVGGMPSTRSSGVWRAPIDNDFGYHGEPLEPQWRGDRARQAAAPHRSVDGRAAADRSALERRRRVTVGAPRPAGSGPPTDRAVDLRLTATPIGD